MLENDLRDPTYGALERIAKALDIPMVILVFLAQGEEQADAPYAEFLSRFVVRSLTGI
jgi:transcriptional regulator with XRE-family HTH domain